MNCRRSDKHAVLIWYIKVPLPVDTPIILAAVALQLYAHPDSRRKVCFSNKPNRGQAIIVELYHLADPQRSSVHVVAIPSRISSSSSA